MYYLHFKNTSIREAVITKNEFQDEPLDEEDFDPENKYKEKKEDEEEKDKKNQDSEENQELLEQENISGKSKDSKDFKESEILSKIPKSYESKAASLLEFWTTDGKLEIHKSGVISIDGKEIKNSNIDDLLACVVRKKRIVDVPEGWNEFLQFLNTSNTPKNLIINPEVLESLIKLEEKKSEVKSSKNS